MDAPAPLTHRFRRAALSVCLFVLVVTSNWATFDKFGSDMPDWDQWDAEALNLFAPWFEHDHFVQHLFQPHNEHRVVLTKLQNLAVCVANGQWDARVECAFNALLHGLIAVGFWVLARRWLAGRWQASAYVAIAALYGLPLAWQNLLGGFHSQQYWLIGSSFAAMVLLPFVRIWSWQWWLGLLAATVALGAMGSGFLAAVVVFGVVIWRWIKRDISRREAWPTLAVMTVLIAIGDLTRVEVPYHQHLKAKTAHDFIFSLLRSLEWPVRDHDWVGVITWLPWVIVAAGAVTELAKVMRSGVRSPRPHEEPGSTRSHAALAIVALGGWVLIQLLATAYARGAGADYPASRYMDTLIFATAVNALALGWLLSRNGNGRAGIRVVLYAIALTWTVTNAFGLFALVRRNLVDELPSTKQYYVQTEAHLRGYLATNDPAELSDPIPYPSAEALIERLAHKSIRDILPESVRPALPLQEADNSDTHRTFVRNWATQRALNEATRAGLSPQTPALASKPTWGSFTEGGLATTGEWQSAPVASPLGGMLKFETAGDIGEPGVALELRDAVTGAVLADVRPTKVPGHTWRSAYVQAPRSAFVVVARDSDPHRWIAFSAPVEMGTISYRAWLLMKNGVLIAEITAVLAAALGLWAWWSAKQDNRTVATRCRTVAQPAN